MKTILVQIVCCLLVSLTASAAVRYVDLNNPNPSAPFTSWATAATIIQDAVDAAITGDEILVTNGVYATGGRAGSRVAVDRAVSVSSVNGPDFTIIRGAHEPDPIRCVTLTNGASLSGFTLTNGSALPWGFGGGVLCASDSASVSNCVIIQNSAGVGGGVSGGTLLHSKLIGNTAAFDGGGAWAPALMNNCLVAGNSAREGGGIRAIGTASFLNCTIVNNSATNNYGGIITSNGPVLNCVIYFNHAPEASNHLIYFGAFASNTCTLPAPPYIGDPQASGNITNAPLFVDFAAGDFRLQPGSAGVDAGNNAFVTTATDLNGAPRINGGSVDMGAFELHVIQPALRLWRSGANIHLGWPLWAGDFELQQVGAVPDQVGSWSNLNASPTVINNENTVTLPLDAGPKLFRLFKP